MHHNIVSTHNGYAKMHVLMPIRPLQPHWMIIASFIARMVIPFAYVVHSSRFNYDILHAESHIAYVRIDESAIIIPVG